MLVAGGASLDITDNKGLTPKLLAIQNDDNELAAYFESKLYLYEGKIIKIMLALLLYRFEICTQCVVYQTATEIRVLDDYVVRLSEIVTSEFYWFRRNRVLEVENNFLEMMKGFI